MRSALITGGAGFIGSHMASRSSTTTRRHPTLRMLSPNEYERVMTNNNKSMTDENT